MEKGFNYKEANSFLTTYPPTKGFFFFFFNFKRGDGWKFWERFPKEKLERKRERDRILV